MRIISAIRCVTISTAEPRSRRSRILANRRSVELRSSAADDSSRISTLGSHSSARPIVIHCLRLSGSPPAGWSSGEIETGQLHHQRLRRRDLRAGRQRFREQPVSADIEVVEDRALVGDQHFLEHGRDADRARLVWRARRVSEDVDLPGIDRQHAGDHLRERALAAAVAAENRVNLAERRAERAAVERPGHVERLAHADDCDAAFAERGRACSAALRPGRGRLTHRRTVAGPGGTPPPCAGRAPRLAPG